MVDVRIVNLTKRFEKVVAVDHANIHIAEGQFYTLLGPSGCGKTTTLRLIAGFYKPDEGEIYFGEKLMTPVPPYKRNTAMVFQNYALFPHMEISKNVAYGLKVRKVKRSEIKEKVDWALKLVHLEGMGKRWPSQLSGGQQQRVALARALVIEPDVLLLDEPLSNLDAKLRVEMRTEIKKIQKKLKTTTVYVTHDQEEALCISDKIAVMDEGVVQQVGTPRAIYEDPQNKFVADFIGIANFMRGKISEIERKRGIMVIDTDYGFSLTAKFEGEDWSKGTAVLASVRPEAITVYRRGAVPEELNNIDGEIRLTTYLGDVARYEIETSWGGTMRADVYNPRHRYIFGEGEKVSIGFVSEDVKIIKL